jgi:hypothetical protein
MKTRNLMIAAALAACAGILLPGAPATAGLQAGNMVQQRHMERSGNNGAVKTELYERLSGDDPNDAGSGDEVGWANSNVEVIEEHLRVTVTLNDAEPQSDFDVYVKINGAVSAPGGVSTNVKGEGAAKFYLDVSMYAGEEGPETIDVQVVVKPAGSTAIDGYATATVPVSMHPDCDGTGPGQQ